MSAWHRPLAEMLTDVARAFETTRIKCAQVRASNVEMTLPIEVWLRDIDGELTFIADVPVWRWRTEFDQRPSSLKITWEETLI
jgi:hypothetical protein